VQNLLNPATVKKRFLLDNDGTNFFLQSMTEEVEGCIAQEVSECPPHVTTYLLCAGAGTYLYPTKVGKITPVLPRFPASRHLHAAWAQGLDPFGMFLKALRTAGKETFVTVRMNDVHDPTDPSQWNTPPLRMSHPEFVVDPGAAATKTGDWMAYCLDYTHPEVRAYFLALLREILDRYDLDGLQLDWMRFPRHLGGNAETVWEKRGLLTEFVASVRQMLRAARKPVLLSCRVPSNPDGLRRLGLDVGEWARQGSIDLLVAQPFLTTDFGMPIGQMRSAMGKNPVPIYAGIDFNHGPQHHCPESLRAAAATLYDGGADYCGADGIYVFNWPSWQYYLLARPYHWLEGLHDPRSAARKPLLFSVAHRAHRIADIDLPGQLPTSLAPGGRLELLLRLPSAALPAQHARALIQSGGDIGLSINGQPTPAPPFFLGPPTEYAELFVEYVEPKAAGSVRPRKEDCRLFVVESSCLRPGANHLAIENRSNKKLHIGRVNLGLW
jgi:hypothetical protein